MSLDPVTAGFDLAKAAIDKIWPDKSEQEKQQLAGVIAVVQGQIDTNKAEAANPNWWVSGWRPYVGWVAGTALGMVYIPKALVLTAIWTYQAITIVSHWTGVGPIPILPSYPDLGVSDLIGLLGSLLGFGGMRMFEKMNGVASK